MYPLNTPIQCSLLPRVLPNSPQSLMGHVNPYMMEGVGEKLRCGIKCALSNSHEVPFKR